MQLYVLRLHKMMIDRKDDAEVAAGVSVVVDEDGLVGEVLTKLSKLIDKQIDGMPLDLEPMTREEVDAWRNADD